MAYTAAQLNRIMQENIVPGVVDLNFKNDPLLAYFKKNLTVLFTGGESSGSILENFMFAELNGGAYDWDGTVAFNTTTEVELFHQTSFDLKTYRIEMNIRLEEMEIFNKGERAVVDLLDGRAANAALTMSKKLSLALYQHGQDKSGDSGADRTLELNGLSEIVCDGTNDSYDTHTFANYGGLARGTYAGLKGKNIDNGGNPLTYPLLTEKLASATIGDKSPTIGVTSNLGLALVREVFQPQQVVNEINAEVGFRSIAVDGVSYFNSQYAPGEGCDIDTADNHEVLWLLTPSEYRFWVTDSPVFGFGFSGFKPGRGDNMLCGQYFFAGNITCQDPRVQVQIFDIGS